MAVLKGKVVAVEVFSGTASKTGKPFAIHRVFLSPERAQDAPLLVQVTDAHYPSYSIGSVVEIGGYIEASEKFPVWRGTSAPVVVSF